MAESASWTLITFPEIAARPPIVTTPAGGFEAEAHFVGDGVLYLAGEGEGVVRGGGGLRGFMGAVHRGGERELSGLIDGDVDHDDVIGIAGEDVARVGDAAAR